MRTALIIGAALTSLAACKKTGDNQYEVQTPTVSRDSGGIRVGTTTDTVHVPVVGTVKDTIVIDKPVVRTQSPSTKRP